MRQKNLLHIMINIFLLVPKILFFQNSTSKNSIYFSDIYFTSLRKSTWPKKIFFSFQCQNVDHGVLNIGKIFKKIFLDLKAEIFSSKHEKLRGVGAFQELFTVFRMIRKFWKKYPNTSQECLYQKWWKNEGVIFDLQHT